MQNRLREVAGLLLVLGAIRIILSIFLFVAFQDISNAAEAAALTPFLVFDVAVGLGMVGAAPFVEKRPEQIASWLLAVWVVTQLVLAFISPARFFSTLVGRIFAAIVLARVLVSARRAAALRRQLTEPANGA